AQRSHPASRTFPVPGGRMVTYENITAGFTVERFVEGEPIVFFGEIEHSDEMSLADLAAALQQYSDAELTDVRKLREQFIFAQMPSIVRHAILTGAQWFPQLRLKCMAATFGLSNLGSVGTTACFGPSVCSAVFGVGRVAERPVVIDGEIEVRPVLTLGLSFDHKAMDARQAAAFLQEVRRLMEGGLKERLQAKELSQSA
ncbi:MAG: 2-oxo acid dehydrogenase subunit E2, partial [Terriglobales bacterium]